MKEKLCVSVRDWFSDMKEWEKRVTQEQQTIKQVQDIVLLFDSFLFPFLLFLFADNHTEREREREWKRERGDREIPVSSWNRKHRRRKSPKESESEIYLTS